MKIGINDFERSKEFLVCVDSDGCAMDTMEIKHKLCFGPMAIEVWGQQHIDTEFMRVWNRVNLYSKTRGINRFKGLVLTFALLRSQGLQVPDLTAVAEWTESTKELSNPSLSAAIKSTGNQQLVKTLEWSKAVNTAIRALPKEDKPFVNVDKGLQLACQFSNIAIVSSANGSAVTDEWTRHDLTKYVDVMLGQEAGTKAACIAALKGYGYTQDHVLMVGDAPGDLEAAQANGVLFYPILAGSENESWKRLVEEACPRFLAGGYQGAYQQRLIAKFNGSLEE